MPSNNTSTSNQKPTDVAAPVVKNDNHDRVVSLSIDKTGAPDQTPGFTIIGDKEAALDATKRQFAEFAVSAVDQEKRVELGLAGAEDGDTADAKIDALKAEHEKAAAAAEKKAEAVVNAAFEG